jgi:hypothetical protein
LFSDDAPLATPEKIKEKLEDVRANKLIIIVNNWESSGNGGCNRDINDPDYGHVKDLTLCDDDLSSFLQGFSSHNGKIKVVLKIVEEKMIGWSRSLNHEHPSHGFDFLYLENSCTVNGYSGNRRIVERVQILNFKKKSYKRAVST